MFKWIKGLKDFIYPEAPKPVSKPAVAASAKKPATKKVAKAKTKTTKTKTKSR